MYNRVDVSTVITDTNATWTYTSTAWRSVDNSANNRASFVMGQAEDGIKAQYMATPSMPAVNSALARAGVSMDATTTAEKQATVITPSSVAAMTMTINARHNYATVLGFHFIQAVEIGDGTNTITWNGNLNQALTVDLKM